MTFFIYRKATTLTVLGVVVLLAWAAATSSALAAPAYSGVPGQFGIKRSCQYVVVAPKAPAVLQGTPSTPAEASGSINW
jgi:hypothetical protein